MRLAIGLLGVGVVVVLGAAPAAADPVQPTHYESQVWDIKVPRGVSHGVSVDVIGGDAYLRLRVAPGTEAVVLGYEDEPYLRFDPSGRVSVNQQSPARWLNSERYHIEQPDGVDPNAAPEWVVVASGGEYAWHDHRIHWMAPTSPEWIDENGGEQHVMDWVVPILVNGHEVEIHGDVVWLPRDSLGSAAALVATLIAGLGLISLRVPSATPFLAAAAATGAAAFAVLRTLDRTPGMDVDWLLLILPALALTFLLTEALVRRRAESSTVSLAWLVQAAASTSLLLWGQLQAGALVRPVVPSPPPVTASRIVVALALGTGVIGVLHSLRRLFSRGVDADNLSPERDRKPRTSTTTSKD